MARNARRLLGFLPVEAGPRLLHERVRRTIGTLLPSGRAGVERVARDLGMSPRSLQRQLEKEGTTFAGLLQELREELADAYVARSNRPITAIAGLLGYASPSAFTRWFNTNFGTSPQEWRARAQSRDGRKARRT